ncbi:trehalose-phosphatase [Rhodococcus rhodochrous]|uniref:Trehalose 6-phosphate phosphatase n=1 Tax=Rhodococcus rhodochrous KG-21 TaxID=1441923 RepID=A0A0M8PFI4_RHORH|nr:trehalose-phosphatase [Rhodococcus rhodochrous]KOS55484.1 haloacid dehalogenase [Rhodococcus rhodochrous KG-21]
MEETSVRDLPRALGNEDLTRRLAACRPAVFLDYDGVLTPIVSRPEDAVISDGMRTVVRDLASRCPVCVVTGRDRAVVQQLMGVDDLVVAGSHGFDIWTPQRGSVSDDRVARFADLVAAVTERLRTETGTIPGALVEPKRASVAVHYRLVDPADRNRIEAIVQTLLTDHHGELKVTPGKMVYELAPAIDWDKGRAVLYLVDVLGLDSADTVPVYLGDDITDEDAFRALRGRGIGILVGRPDDPEMAGRNTAAEFALASVDEVERFLTTLAR